MDNLETEKPVTIGLLHRTLDERLIRFYHEVMRPDMGRMMDHMGRMMEDKIESRLKPLRDEMLHGFDDLYKKFEMLHQEYIFTNEHIRRLDEAVFGKKN